MAQQPVFDARLASPPPTAGTTTALERTAGQPVEQAGAQTTATPPDPVLQLRPVQTTAPMAPQPMPPGVELPIAAPTAPRVPNRHYQVLGLLRHQRQQETTALERTAGPPVEQAGAQTTATPPDPFLQLRPAQTTAPMAPQPMPPGAQLPIAAPTAPRAANLHHQVLGLLRHQRQQETAGRTAPNRQGRHVLRPHRQQQQQLLFDATTAPPATDPLRPQRLPLAAEELAATTAPRPEGMAIAPAGPIGATGNVTGPVPGTTAPHLIAVDARNATFAPPVLVARISLLEVSQRFQEAQTSFELQRKEATEDVEPIVTDNLTRVQKKLVRLAMMDLLMSWESAFNNILGAFFHRWGCEQVPRLGKNASGECFNEYKSKAPVYHQFVKTVERLGLVNSYNKAHMHVIL